MATGTVKWFHPTKGYGFVQPEAAERTCSSIFRLWNGAELSTLNEGAMIEYDIVANKGKESAENIKVK